MNDVHKFPERTASDADGLLYDPGVRKSMAMLATDSEIGALEAAAALRSAWQAVDRLRTKGAGGRGLSTGALDVLGRLKVSDHDLSIGDLARACGVSSRNVTGLVDTLAGNGLAERVPDPRDRRTVRVKITAAGHEWLESFRRPTDRAMSAIFAGFAPEELAQLRHLCLRVVDNQRAIEQYLNGTPPP
ncbi:MarR family winged helix-turn-helix transcriptional regulator [Nocardia sp. NBC_01327]|uniref:MarR family winged helix-turn-helix transcriptional regulator n=1 Tax=Nocardia sp. NBC_01327 TaxID=2903593 RepID=UPI002E10C6D0|nr:MarR family transcriptional regulator [Nocardia sp. NBC_01327]